MTNIPKWPWAVSGMGQQRNIHESMNPQHWSPPGEWEQLGLGKEELVCFGDVGMSPKCPGSKFQLERGGPLLVSLPWKFRAGWSHCSREGELGSGTGDAPGADGRWFEMSPGVVCSQQILLLDFLPQLPGIQSFRWEHSSCS